MAISSINFKGVKEGSEMHNDRSQKLHYVHSELKDQNREWKDKSIGVVQRECEKYCKDTTGRKMQKNSKVVREAVLNLNPDHTMQDLSKLTDKLKEQYKIEAFQIYIHRDEGFKNETTEEIKINHHAHILFNWQDRSGTKETNKNIGKTLKLTQAHMREIQTLVAKELKMERGKEMTKEEIENNKGKGRRLEAIEFKEKKAIENLERIKEVKKELETEINGLEQKKNRNDIEADRLRHEEKRVRNRFKDLPSDLNDIEIRLQGQRTRVYNLNQRNKGLREEFKTVGIFNQAEEERLTREQNELQAISEAERVINILENGEISPKDLEGISQQGIYKAIQRVKRGISEATIEAERRRTEIAEAEERRRTAEIEYYTVANDLEG